MSTLVSRACGWGRRSRFKDAREAFMGPEEERACISGTSSLSTQNGRILRCHSWALGITLAQSTNMQLRGSFLGHNHR